LKKNPSGSLASSVKLAILNAVPAEVGNFGHYNSLL